MIRDAPVAVARFQMTLSARQRQRHGRCSFAYEPLWLDQSEKRGTVSGAGALIRQGEEHTNITQ